MGGFVHPNNSLPMDKEQIILVSEQHLNSEPLDEPVLNVDFVSLFPAGLDPLADNLLIQKIEREDFTGDILLSEESNNIMLVAPNY